MASAHFLDLFTNHLITLNKVNVYNKCIGHSNSLMQKQTTDANWMESCNTHNVNVYLYVYAILVCVNIL